MAHSSVRSRAKLASLALCLIGWPSAAAWSEPERPAAVSDLPAALAETYAANPQLLSARAMLRSADFRLPAARARYGPRVDVDAGYGFERDRYDTALGPVGRSGWTVTAEAILTQSLVTFGRNAAAEQGAVATIDYQREVLRATEQEVLFNAISSYVAVLRDRSGLGIARDNLASLTRELDDTRARFLGREVTSTDLEQVRSRVELGRAGVLTATRQLAQSEAEFLGVVGRPAGDLAPAPPLALPSIGLSESYARGQADNPVIAAARARERISRADVHASRAERLPQVGLRGTAATLPIEPYSNSLRQSELRGEVIASMPLFTSGMLSARIAEAQEVDDANWRLIDNALRENAVELASAWNEWQALSATLERLRSAIDAARAAYDGAVKQERAGLRTTLDVLDLARDQLNAETTYNNAVTNHYLAQARVLRALGALGYTDLVADARPDDTLDHFERVRLRGDIPLLTPLIRAIDLGPNRIEDRPSRDEPQGSPPVEIPTFADDRSAAAKP